MPGYSEVSKSPLEELSELRFLDDSEFTAKCGLSEMRKGL